MKGYGGNMSDLITYKNELHMKIDKKCIAYKGNIYRKVTNVRVGKKTFRPEVLEKKGDIDPIKLNVDQVDVYE